MSRTQIGTLNRRATLLQKTQTDDGGGGYRISWETIDTVWAGLSLNSAATSYIADTLSPQINATITIRRRTDIASGWRVTIDDKSYDVNAVCDPGPQTVCITLSCTVRP